jgi:hypothetical protein
MRSDLDRLCERENLTADFAYGQATKPAPWEGAAHNWRVTLRYKRRKLTVDFYGGALVENPGPADVLSGLILDASDNWGTFEEFCADLGYDTDSRQAEATWKACAKMAPKVRRFLGEDFNKFAQAEH